MFILKIVVAVLFGAGFIGGIAKYLSNLDKYDDAVKDIERCTRYGEAPAELPKKPSKLPLVLAMLSLIALIVVPFSIRTVDTGEIAVVKRLGKVHSVETAGTHFNFWAIDKYVIYDAKVQNIETSTMAYSSDAQTMDVAMTIQYQILGDKVVDIATHYGSLEALQSRIGSVVIEKTKAVLSSYKAMDIIANRAAVSPAVEDAIKNAVGEEYCVDITTVALTNIDFSNAFEQAVEDKMIAEQTKLKADYENQTKIAKVEAEAAAELKAAQAKIEIAKAEAEAIKIEAEAQAEANKIIDASLTDKIIDKQMADAWDGKLPAVVGEADMMLPSSVIG